MKSHVSALCICVHLSMCMYTGVCMYMHLHLHIYAYTCMYITNRNKPVLRRGKDTASRKYFIHIMHFLDAMSSATYRTDSPQSLILCAEYVPVCASGIFSYVCPYMAVRRNRCTFMLNGVSMHQPLLYRLWIYSSPVWIPARARTQSDAHICAWVCVHVHIHTRRNTRTRVPQQILF